MASEFRIAGERRNDKNRHGPAPPPPRPIPRFRLKKQLLRVLLNRTCERGGLIVL
jgi:hypothetical protein